MTEHEERATSGQNQPLDEETWAAARSGSSEAWEAVVDRYSRLVHHAVASFRLSPADSADAVQATWVRLFEHADAIRCAGSLGGWLFTTARRECLAIIRRSSRYAFAEVEDLVAAEDLARGPEQTCIHAETTRRVRTAVGRLPDRRRALIHELYYAESPYRSISAQLDIPVGSIGPTRARSLAELRTFLGEDDSDARSASRVPVGAGFSGR